MCVNNNNTEEKLEEEFAEKYHNLKLSNEDAICICKRETPDGPKIRDKNCLAKHEDDEIKPPED